MPNGKEYAMGKLRLVIMMLFLLLAAPGSARPLQQESPRAENAVIDTFLEELSDGLNSEDPKTRQQAEKDLLRILPAMQRLIEEAPSWAKTGDSKGEWAAALDEIRNASRTQLFLLKMDDDSRLQVEDLARSMPNLFSRIGSSDWKMREALAKDLSTKATPGAIPILIGFLEDDNMQVRKYAVRGLGEIRDQRAVEPLLEFFRSIPPRVYTPESRSLMEESDAIVELVTVALGQLKDRRATPLLVKFAGTGPYLRARGNAITALGEIGNSSALPFLVGQLDSTMLRTQTVRNGQTIRLMDCDLALEAILKITDQARSDYGMMAPGSFQLPGTGYEFRFDNDEARKAGISRMKSWWEENSVRFVSDDSMLEFNKDVAAQNLKMLESPGSGIISDSPSRRLRSYANSGDLETLLKEAVKIMNSQPQLSTLVRMELIMAYRQRDRLNELAEYWEEALRKDPGDVPAFSMLGEIYRAQNKPLKAIEVYEAAAKLDPDQAQVHTSLGLLYYSQKEYEKAIRSYKLASKLAPSSPANYSMMARIYGGMGRKDEAFALAGKVLDLIESKKIPVPPVAYASLGDIYQAAGRYDEAIKAYQKAISLSPPIEPLLKHNLARAYESAGKPELAENIRGAGTPESARIGKDALSFTLKDLSGRTVRMADFAGKVVLLDFWATWCGPCINEIPHLEALQKKYSNKGLVVLGMNTESDHIKVKSFADERISYLVVMDAEKLSKEYGVQGLPTKIYIDAKGKIRYRDLGFAPGNEISTEEKIKTLLHEIATK